MAETVGRALPSGLTFKIVDIGALTQEEVAAEVARILPLLPDTERARISKYVQPIDRLRSIAACSLMLEEAQKDREAGVRIERQPRGKPHLVDSVTGERLPIECNISHQGPYIMLGSVATACAREEGLVVPTSIGVDIMDFNSLAFLNRPGGVPSLGAMLHDAELKFLESIADPHLQKLGAAIVITMKESICKATGEGITADLRAYDYSGAADVMLKHAAEAGRARVALPIQKDWDVWECSGDRGWTLFTFYRPEKFVCTAAISSTHTIKPSSLELTGGTAPISPSLIPYQLTDSHKFGRHSASKVFE